VRIAFLPERVTAPAEKAMREIVRPKPNELET